MNAFIDAHRDTFGVEPIRQTLAVAPSTYHASRSRPPSAWALRHERPRRDVSRVHEADLSVCGVRNTWHRLRREHIAVGCDRVGGLMGSLGLAGATRTRLLRTTMPTVVAGRPDDLVERVFRAPAPDRLWVADLTYVRTRSGFCYASFVIDAFGRRILGWRVSPSLRTDLALDALEMAMFARGDRALAGLAHHSDRRLAEAGAVASVGSRGDSYDNALAETVNDLYKAELINRKGPWRSTEQVELATSEWVHWWNTQRLHSARGDVPPAEYEELPRRLAAPMMEWLGIDRLAALHLAIDLVRRGGTLSIIGLYAGTVDPMPMTVLFDKQIRIHMGQVNVRRWPDDLLPLVEPDVLGLERFASHHLPLEDAPDAYARFQPKADGVLKVLFDPWASWEPATSSA